MNIEESTCGHVWNKTFSKLSFCELILVDKNEINIDIYIDGEFQDQYLDIGEFIEEVSDKIYCEIKHEKDQIVFKNPISIRKWIESVIK